MHVEELIVRIGKATALSDVLDPADLRKEYKAAIKLLHPDLCGHKKASEALIRLNELKELYVHGRSYKDDAGEFRWFGKKVFQTKPQGCQARDILGNKLPFANESQWRRGAFLDLVRRF